MLLRSIEEENISLKRDMPNPQLSNGHKWTITPLTQNKTFAGFE